MGLEPSTFCMAIVSTNRVTARFCGFRLNPITGDYRGFGGYWSPSGPPGFHGRPSAGLERTVAGVPRISFFYGIAIYMYWDEGAHARPHFHARYSGQVASVSLDGELIAGSLPPRAAALVAEWARLHRAELEANWERARREEALEAIDPLP